MIRILLLFTVFIYNGEAISQHILTTRIENTTLVQWAENRIKILIEGHMCHEIVVSTTKGRIQMNSDNCEIIYTAPDTGIHRTTIKIGIKGSKGVNWLEEIDLPVLRFPDPIPMIGGYPSGSSISKSSFLHQSSINVPVEDGWHHIQDKSKQRITSYSVKISRQDSIIFNLTNIIGFRLPQDLIEFSRSSIRQDDVIIFYDIETLIYSHEKRVIKGAYQLIVE